MGENLENSVFTVTGSDLGHFGTAFIFHKDETSTYFLTCMHVIDEIGGCETVLVDGHTAVLIIGDGADGFDLAVLRTDSVFEDPALKLDDYNHSTGDVTINGYCLYGIQRINQSIGGKLISQGKVESPDLRCRCNCWHLEVIHPLSLEKGYSGAPVVDQSSKKVIGVINQRRGKGNQGLVISISSLKEICREDHRYLLVSLKPVPLSKVVHLEEDPPLINFEEEISVFEKIITGVDPLTKIISVTGKGFAGKSRLLREYRILAEKSKYHTLPVDLKQQTNIEFFLEQIVVFYGFTYFTHFNQFLLDGRPEPLTREKEREWFYNLTRQFFLDLEAYPKAPFLMMLIDHYERADFDFKKWLNTVYLPRNLLAGPIITVIAGQESIQIGSHSPQLRHFSLQGLSKECVHQYASDCNVSLSPEFIELLYNSVGGRPGFIAQFIQGNSKEC